jgi:hypothetical protein
MKRMQGLAAVGVVTVAVALVLSESRVATAIQGKIADVFVTNDASSPIPVAVDFPEVQPVGGTVNVGNLPATQAVSGTVAVSNLLPAAPPVTTMTVNGGMSPGEAIFEGFFQANPIAPAANERFVVESISGRIVVPSGQQLTVVFFTTLLPQATPPVPNVFVGTTHIMTPTLVATGVLGADVYAFTTCFRVHNQGPAPSLSVQRVDTTGVVFVSAAISGYIVPAP